MLSVRAYEWLGLGLQSVCMAVQSQFSDKTKQGELSDKALKLVKATIVEHPVSSSKYLGNCFFEPFVYSSVNYLRH